MKKKPIKKKITEEICPQGKDPLYCRHCIEKRMLEAESRLKESRRLHNLY